VQPTPAIRTDGVVIVEPRLGVLWWSAGIESVLASEGVAWRRGMPCCEALGCARNTSEDEPRCLTRLALAKPEGLDPRPWRGGPGPTPTTGSLHARPVRTDGTYVVVFELRDLVTVQAPVQTSMALALAAVEVTALGRLSVRVRGEPLDGDWQHRRPGEVFRYLLASRTAPAPSEAIASALWPDRGPSAVANVRYCVFKLRQQLGGRGDPGGSPIIHGAAGYRLDPRRLKLDVDLFERQATTGLAAHRRGEREAAETPLTQALSLYRGDFLAEDPYVDWAFNEREYLRSLAGRTLAATAEIALADGRLEVAADRLQRLARLEPFDSRVHQMLIEVCLRRGRRTEAVRHYSALRTRLQRAFGEQPDFDLARLAARITGDGAATGALANAGSPGAGDAPLTSMGP
jgi:DNA-binding SARP family transcriptional activator